MTDLDEVDPAVFLQRADDAVNAVSRIAIDAGDPQVVRRSTRKSAVFMPA